MRRKPSAKSGMLLWVTAFLFWCHEGRAAHTGPPAVSLVEGDSRLNAKLVVLMEYKVKVLEQIVYLAQLRAQMDKIAKEQGVSERAQFWRWRWIEKRIKLLSENESQLDQEIEKLREKLEIEDHVYF